MRIDVKGHVSLFVRIHVLYHFSCYFKALCLLRLFPFVIFISFAAALFAIVHKRHRYWVPRDYHKVSNSIVHIVIHRSHKCWRIWCLLSLFHRVTATAPQTRKPSRHFQATGTLGQPKWLPKSELSPVDPLREVDSKAPTLTSPRNP